MSGRRCASVVLLLAAIVATGGASPSNISLRSYVQVQMERGSPRALFMGDRAYVAELTADMSPLISEFSTESFAKIRSIPTLLRASANDELLVWDRRGPSYYLDPLTDAKTQLSHAELLPFTLTNLVYYENEVYYASTSRGEFVEHLVRVDLVQAKTREYGGARAPVDISPDRMNLLVDSNNGLQVWNIGREAPAAQIAAPGRSAREAATARFITNGVLITVAPDSSLGSGFMLWGIDGRPLEEVRFSLGNGSQVWSINFSRGLDRAFISVMPKGGASDLQLQRGFVDSTEFMQYIQGKYSFRPREGTLRSAGVRLRVYPNLEAKVLQKLADGAKVMVLDRSGVKVQIGTTNDFWYRVRTPSGAEGWVFGAYLNVVEGGQQ